MRSPNLKGKAMANEDKIRIINEQLVAGTAGPLFIRTFAGPEGATKPTENLANGSLYIKTDSSPAGAVAWWDEATGKWSDA